jgi:hypothetical protein
MGVRYSQNTSPAENTPQSSQGKAWTTSREAFRLLVKHKRAVSILVTKVMTTRLDEYGFEIASLRLAQIIQ